MEFQQSLVRTKVSKVPSFLVDSEFHKSLSSEADGDESICIPLPCFKQDETVENEVDVENLLNTSRYWGVNHISLSIVRYYLLEERPVSPEIIAEFGKDHTYLNNIKTIQEHPKSKQLDRAISVGDTELAVAMFRAGYAWTERTAAEAARVGNLPLLKFTRANGCVWDKTAAYEAAANGHLDCLKYTREEHCPWDERTLAVAFKKNVDCVRYICEQATVSERSTWLTQKQTENAVFLGTLEMLMCLRSVDSPWGERVATIAAREGKLDCLRYACYNGCPVTAEATNTAARWGHLDCLQFLHEEGVAWGPETCESAVRGGSLPCLQFLHTSGCPWDARTCTAAARADRLDILQFAHVSESPWDAHTCGAAAALSTVDCLQYLFEQGCPHDADVMRVAARAGKLMCLKYLHQQGCRFGIETARAAATGARNNFECLQYLCEECGCQLDVSVMEEALDCGNDKCVQYLINRGCAYDAEQVIRINAKGLSMKVVAETGLWSKLRINIKPW